MAAKKKDRSSRLKSLFDNDLFLSELKKIKDKIAALPDDEEYGSDIEVIKLRRRWNLTWEYHETLTNFVETSLIDYELGDKDIRIVDYKAEELHPSSDPKGEFRIMMALRMTESDHQRGVYLKLPKEITQTELKDFISKHFHLIEAALDSNHPGRIKYQQPEQQSKRKVKIFRMHEEGISMKEICVLNNCESSYVHQVVKEFKDKIKD